MWHGIAMIMYGSGVGLGGVIGGVINETWGWRWAFLALTPLTVISALGVAFFLPALTSSNEQSLGSRLRRIDFSGSAALILAIALLLIGLNQEDFNAASSRRILEIALPLAAAFFVVFVFIELRYAKEPVIPIDLLGKRTVFGACIAGWFTAMALYTRMFYVPLYLQLRGYNTSETGLRLLPEPIGVAIGSFSAGLIMRLTGRYGILKTFALALSIAGNAGFATVSMSSPLVLPEIHLFLSGLGFGGTLTVILLALLSSVSHEQQAVTTSILYAFRSTGATLGISTSSVVFRKLLQSRLGELAIPGALHSNAMPGDLGDVLRRCNRSNRSSPDDCVHLIDGYMYALHGTFLLAVGFAVAGFFSGMVTKNYQLRTSFESEEREDAGHVNSRTTSG
jgi:predicted MFS family arabinose efflux permease